MKQMLALLGLFLILSGISFAEENAASNYTYHCFSSCCHSQGAIYSETPSQHCTGAGPEFDANQERCVERCIHELDVFYNGSNYTPPGISNPPSAGNTGASSQPNESALPNEKAPPLANLSVSEPTSSNAGSVPLPQKGDYPDKGKTGGLCGLGFALLLPLFFSVKK